MNILKTGTITAIISIALMTGNVFAQDTDHSKATEKSTQQEMM